MLPCNDTGDKNATAAETSWVMQKRVKHLAFKSKASIKLPHDGHSSTELSVTVDCFHSFSGTFQRYCGADKICCSLFLWFDFPHTKR